MAKFQFNGITHEKEGETESIWLTFRYDNDALQRYYVRKGEYVELSKEQIGALEGGKDRLALLDEVKTPRRGSARAKPVQTKGDPPASAKAAAKGETSDD